MHFSFEHTSYVSFLTESRFFGWDLDISKDRSIVYILGIVRQLVHGKIVVSSVCVHLILCHTVSG